MSKNNNKKYESSDESSSDSDDEIVVKPKKKVVKSLGGKKCESSDNSDSDDETVGNHKKKVCKSGYLYCIYNKIFNYYGENVKKLGKVGNKKSLIPRYTTPYIEKSEILYISKKVKDYSLAEKFLFFRLQYCRVKKNREFFKCDLKEIEIEINNCCDIINSSDDYEILKLANEIRKNKYPLFKISAQELLDAEFITKNIYEKLTDKKILKRNEYIIIEKYKYIKLWNIRKENFNKKFLKIAYNNTYKLENLKELLDNFSIIHSNFIKPVKIVMEQFKKKHKLKIVIDFLKCMKIDDLTEGEKFCQIEMDKRKKSVMKNSFLFKNRDYCHMLFGWKKNKQIDTNKGWLGFVNSFIGNYGLKVYRERKTTTKKKIVVNINNYYLKPVKEIYEFIK